MRSANTAPAGSTSSDRRRAATARCRGRANSGSGRNCSPSRVADRGVPARRRGRARTAQAPRVRCAPTTATAAMTASAAPERKVRECRWAARSASIAAGNADRVTFGPCAAHALPCQGVPSPPRGPVLGCADCGHPSARGTAMRTRLGHYDIVAELGRGGMGVVYKGHESSLNRYVAIKVLADSLAHDEAVKERFLREARSMAALNDPHIIQIYFIGEDEGGQTYFVMEFVDGESLGSMLKREGKLSVEQSAKVIHQTAMGLSTAHDRGVVHRDIKPGNLMINSRGA